MTASLTPTPTPTPTDAGGANDLTGREIDILARTIFGEARGESIQGKRAVAAVVMNRVRRARRASAVTYWWGNDTINVCQKPWQFSCWNPGDPNREKIEAVTSKNRAFQTCLKVAKEAAANQLADPTGGATHYHAKSVRPPWARNRTPSAEIGNHLFYTDIE